MVNVTVAAPSRMLKVPLTAGASRRWGTTTAFSLIVCGLWSPPVSHAASFSCSGVTHSRQEALICKDEHLSRLDDRLSVLYTAALSASGSDESVRAKQREWLRETRSNCADRACLEYKYQERIAELERVLYAAEPKPRLSAEQARVLGDQAAAKSGHDLKVFLPSPFHFDPIDQDWSAEYTQYAESGVYKSFLVFVDDPTSRTDVTCTGLSAVLDSTKPSDLPSDVRALLAGSGYVTRLYCVDLNGDGRPDYLVVREDRPYGQYPVERELLILLRQPDGSLRVSESSGSVLPPPGTEGSSGGYGVVVKRNKFCTENSYGGGGLGETYEYCFAYSREEKTWLLRSVEHDVWGAKANWDNEPPHVTFKEFDPSKYEEKQN